MLLVSQEVVWVVVAVVVDVVVVAMVGPMQFGTGLVGSCSRAAELTDLMLNCTTSGGLSFEAS